MNNLTVLVVDDDQGVVTMIKNALESEGFHVYVGFDGQMAMNLARRHRPHVLIMDVHMPMTNGLQALEWLRQTDETKALPIIVLTGARSDTIYPVIDRHQRVVFMKKPIDIDGLIGSVRELVEKYGN